MGEYGNPSAIFVTSFATACGMCKVEREDRVMRVEDVLIAFDRTVATFDLCADCITRLYDSMKRTR